MLNDLLACTRILCAVATPFLQHCEADANANSDLWDQYLECLTVLRMELNESALFLEMG